MSAACFPSHEGRRTHFWPVCPWADTALWSTGSATRSGSRRWVFSAAAAIPPSQMRDDPEGLRRAVEDGSALSQVPGIPPKYDAFALTVVAERLASAEKRFPQFYMACGDMDSSYERAQDYRDFLRSMGVDVTWDGLPGYGHEWRFWDIEVEKFLDWIPRSDLYSREGKRRV